jgi:hypothetical protein
MYPQFVKRPPRFIGRQDLEVFRQLSHFSLGHLFGPSTQFRRVGRLVILAGHCGLPSFFGGISSDKLWQQ